jgi:hypothetical protein
MFLFFVCNPLRARFWFNWREPITLAFSGLVFGVIFLVVWSGFDTLAVGLIIGSLVSFLVKFFWLDKMVLVIKCPNPECGKFVEIDTPWLCGFKEDGAAHENVNTGAYPFVKECECCHKRPKAYQCHHCEELIYLSKDEDKRNFAKRLGNIKTKIDPREEKVTKQIEKIQDKSLEYEVAKLDRKIKIEKSLPVKPEDKSLVDEIEAELEKDVAIHFTFEEAAARLHAKVDEKYKDNDFEKKRHHLAIDDAAKKRRLAIVNRNK